MEPQPIGRDLIVARVRVRKILEWTRGTTPDFRHFHALRLLAEHGSAEDAALSRRARRQLARLAAEVAPGACDFRADFKLLPSEEFLRWDAPDAAAPPREDSAETLRGFIAAAVTFSLGFFAGAFL